jgi:hypothetical protein
VEQRLRAGDIALCAERCLRREGSESYRPVRAKAKREERVGGGASERNDSGITGGFEFLFMTTRVSEEVRYCPTAGPKLRASGWNSRPPSSASSVVRGELWVPPCTPECETVMISREWEADVSRRKAQALHEKSEMPERLARSDLDASTPPSRPRRPRSLGGSELSGSWERDARRERACTFAAESAPARRTWWRGWPRAHRGAPRPDILSTRPRAPRPLRPSGGRDGTNGLHGR